MAKKKVGIIGGGQLALMLAEGAKELGLLPIALMDSSEEPAFKVARGSYLMQPGDAHPIHDFLAAVEIVVFENEFFSDEIVAHAGPFAGKFRPSLETIAILRDKLRQKELFTKLGLASAPYQAMPSGADALAWAKSMIDAHQGECVFKWATGGYDGRGVCFADGSPDAPARCGTFCAEAGKKGVTVFVEKKIPFKRELAMIAVRSGDGYFTNYPLVVSEAQNGVCKLVTGPSSALGVNLKLDAEASSAAGKIASATGLVGAFGLEFFEDHEGKLWVNEVAPRVHNSGHYTQDASESSQFVNHWQACLGISLADPTTTCGAFAMLNLLGPPESIDEVIPFSLKLPEGVTYHDYGKRRSRAGRKMGHLNGIVQDPEDLPVLVESMKRCEREWLAKMSAQKK